MYLYGASGHGKVIRDILESKNIKIKAFIDDNKELTKLGETPVIHDCCGCEPIIISVGNNSIRKKIAASLKVKFGTAVAESAMVATSAKINEGTVVMQGAVVQSDAVIGKHCIINTAATVDHDCLIEDFVHISPNATLCGNVTVREGTWVGAGSTIIQGITIGKNCIIAAGSVVTKDIPDNVLAAGNRCKVIKEINNE